MKPRFGNDLRGTPAYVRRGVFVLSFLSLLSSAAPVLANPEGGVVAAGVADIVASGNRLDITQRSDRTVIDWRSFNISKTDLTEFHQPSSGSIAINRVNDANPSQILGSLKANGNVVIINPSGVMFGKDAQVDVGGLIATTLDVDNDDFMAGGAIKFNRKTISSGTVSNEGLITAREAGLVGLVATQVENSGIIRARMGRVVLASGDSATVDFQGDGLLALEVTDDSSKRLIRHSGMIEADGGEVLLTAAAGRSIVDNLIEVKGEIKTPSVGVRNGKIVIGAAGVNRTTRTGAKSRVTVSGTLSAQGDNSGEKGGEIQVLGDVITVAGTSRIQADGKAGGGTVNIGGSFQGGLPGADYALLPIRRPELEELQAAEIVVVEEGAQINASATESGDGGVAILWADRGMYYNGLVSARGGDVSGDGGFVEVSGKNYLDFRGVADTRALYGDVGTLLLDPTDIEIKDMPDQNVTFPDFYTPTGDDVVSILDVDTLENNMHWNYVTVQTRATGTQAGNITVSDSLYATSESDWDGYSYEYMLTLDAHNDIIINAPMTYANYGRFTFKSGRDTVINAAVDGSQYYFQTGRDLVVNAAVLGGGSGIYINPLNADTSVGIGVGSGTFTLDADELAQFTSKNFYLGTLSSANVGDVEIGSSAFWNYFFVRTSAAGSVTFTGSNTAGTTYIQTDHLNLAGVLTGNGSSSLTLTPLSTTTAVDLGAGLGGPFSIDPGAIGNGWSSINIGNVGSTAAMTVGAHSWSGHTTLQSGSGGMSITGDQTLAAGKSLTLATRTLSLDGDIEGDGTLTIRPDTSGVSMGIGDGAAGTLNLTDAELDHIRDGWSKIVFGYDYFSSAMDVRARNWSDSVKFTSGAGALTINGAQNVGANNLEIFTNNPVINAPLIGSGTLTLRHYSGIVSVGLAGAAGTFNLTAAELDQIQDGWNEIVIGNPSSGGTYTVGAYTWRDPVTFQLGGVTSNMVFSGAQNFGDNNVTIKANRLVDLNAELIGSSQITFAPTSTGTQTNIGGGAASQFRISSFDMTNYLFGNGWSSYSFGNSSTTGTITLGAGFNWDADVLLQSSGAVTVSAYQDFGANDFTLITNTNPTITGGLVGAGTLTIQPKSTGVTMGIAGGAGVVNLDVSEMNNIYDGWSKLVFGRTDSTGALEVGTYSWQDPAYFLTGGTLSLTGNHISTDVSADSNKLVFSAGQFSNGGGYTVDPGTGRYLVYSTDPAADNYGGLTRATKRYNKTYASYAPDAVTESGNVFLYSIAPTIDVTINDRSRAYGVNNPPFTYSFDLTDLIDGDAITDAVSSEAISTAAVRFSPAGNYAITGNFLSEMGYQFNVTDGNLSVFQQLPDSVVRVSSNPVLVRDMLSPVGISSSSRSFVDKPALEISPSQSEEFDGDVFPLSNFELDQVVHSLPQGDNALIRIERKLARLLGL